MLRVILIAMQDALGSTLSIPTEMLSAASDIAKARRQEFPQLSLRIATGDGMAIKLKGGIRLEPDCKLADCGSADLIFIAGFWGNPQATLARNPAISQWLGQHSSTPMCALTTGSYFLAQAGLLDGREATTHWRFFEHFAQRFPEVCLQRSRFITRSANRYCTGSVDAVRDVILHFVAHFFSEDIAREIARQFTHEAGPSLQSALLAKAPSDAHHDESIAALQAYLHENFSQDLPLNALAERAALSTRSLTRRFKAATGTSLGAYLRSIRLEQARQLLRESDLGSIEICALVGYKDSSHFIAAFKRYTGSTPKDYRRLVRAKLFAAH